MDEIVPHFGVDMPTLADVPSETVEGALGLVVIQKDVLRLVKSIPWGDGPKTVQVSIKALCLSLGQG